MGGTKARGDSVNKLRAAIIIQPRRRLLSTQREEHILEQVVHYVVTLSITL